MALVGRVVWLVGMMGAGKSAVGRALAARLGRPFVDTDERVERASGRSIEQIFREDGEAAFRRLERQAVEAVAGGDAVVALGGGAIAQPGAAERLAASGIVVYLRASPEELAERIAREAGRGGARARPLLEGLDAGARVARLRELLAQRESAYRTAALVVDTDGRGVDELAAELERSVRSREGAGADARPRRTGP